MRPVSPATTEPDTSDIASAPPEPTTLAVYTRILGDIVRGELHQQPLITMQQYTSPQAHHPLQQVRLNSTPLWNTTS